MRQKQRLLHKYSGKKLLDSNGDIHLVNDIYNDKF